MIENIKKGNFVPSYDLIRQPRLSRDPTENRRETKLADGFVITDTEHVKNALFVIPMIIMKFFILSMPHKHKK